MAAAFPSFDPGRVLMGTSGSSPYVNVGGPQASGTPGGAGPAPAQGGGSAIVPFGTASTNVAPETVRATGSGPFDSAYRQNLATYAGGQFARPGGNLSFNPTDASTFPGNPTGFGTAPLPGLPDSLTSRAIGGNPFSFAPPQPSPAATATTDQQPTIQNFQDWLQQFRQQGNGFAMGAYQQ